MYFFGSNPWLNELTYTLLTSSRMPQLASWASAAINSLSGHLEALKARQFREQEDKKMPAPELEEVPAYGD